MFVTSKGVEREFFLTLSEAQLGPLLTKS